MLTSDEKAVLNMFKPDTYAICLDPQDSAGLVEKGLIEWVPAVWGDTPNYAITDAGRDALDNSGQDQ